MELKENEIMLGDKIIEIKPVKFKWMKLGWWKSYLSLKEQGLIKLLSKENGVEVLMVFLQGILDIPKIEGELLESLNEHLSDRMMKEVLVITERINLIKE